MSEEIWKDIKGYEGLYRISNTGKIINRFNKFMKIGKDRNYMYVYLCKCGESKQLNLRTLLDNHFDNHIYSNDIVDELDEIWKPVHLFEGKYSISSKGRVRSERRFRKGKNGSTSIVNERIRVPCDDSYGYLIVVLYDEEFQRTVPIHRLVAEHFIPNPNNLPQVNHKDGNKHNNCVGNLEWCTNLENIRHSVKIGIRNYSDSSGIKLHCVEDDVYFNSIAELSRIYNLNYNQCLLAIKSNSEINGKHYMVISKEEYENIKCKKR